MQIDVSLAKDQRILLAAEKVFSARGYEKATIDEIIALADVGKGTVYKYFGNKEQLFYKLISDKNIPFIKQIKEAVNAAEGIEAKLFAYMKEMVSFYRENYALWQIMCFEMLGVSNGCHVLKEDGEYKILSRYSNVEPSEQLKEQVLRYYMVMESEFTILHEVMQEGMKVGFLKKGNSQIVSRELFWSVAMCVFNQREYDAKFSAEEIAAIIIDRFLYGSAIQKNASV